MLAVNDENGSRCTTQLRFGQSPIQEKLKVLDQPDKFYRNLPWR